MAYYFIIIKNECISGGIYASICITISLPTLDLFSSAIICKDPEFDRSSLLSSLTNTWSFSVIISCKVKSKLPMNSCLFRAVSYDLFLRLKTSILNRSLTSKLYCTSNYLTQDGDKQSYITSVQPILRQTVPTDWYKTANPSVFPNKFMFGRFLHET